MPTTKAEFMNLLRAVLPYAQWVAGPQLPLPFNDEVSTRGGEEFSRLVKAFRSVLSPCLDDREHILVAVPTVMDSQSYREFKVKDFTRQAVRCAVLFGAEQTADLLWDLREGSPIRYEERWPVQGVYQTRKAITVGRGVRLLRLDGTFKDLPEPLDMHYERLFLGLHGTTALSIDATASPAFLKPDGRESHTRDDLDWDLSFRQPVHIFATALALACNSPVRISLGWAALDPAFAVLVDAHAGPLRSYPSDTRELATETEVTPTNAKRALAICAKIPDEESSPLNVAIRRWMRAKPLGDLVDASIDARIALEALFLPDGGQELSFRLATRGAWYLGADGEERMKCFDTLKRAYDAGSSAVHKGTLKNVDKKLLAEALDLCRSAIQKRLTEGEPPIWKSLVLGAS